MSEKINSELLEIINSGESVTVEFKKGILKMTIPEKPTSRNQKYISK